MRRRAWFELHDHPLFPRFLRDLVTDALQMMWNAQNTYAPILPRLRRALRASGGNRIVDLCSGGGGPWLRLSRDSVLNGETPLQVCLTDIYPNRRAFEQLQQEAQLEFCPDPVDATRIPPGLTGFRTIFSSFHHFGPDQARAILQDAFDQRQGIAVFETATRRPRTLMAIFLLPLLTLWLAPRIRPFRWSRLLFTYLAPVIPFTIWMDGLLSCLRSYSESDFEELTVGMRAADYIWEIGIESNRLVGVAYLIGYPIRRSCSDTVGEERVMEEAETAKPA